MAEVKIPIFGGTYDTDDTGITSSKDDFEIRNGYLDKNRTIHKRPVMRESGTDNPTARDIIGLTWWNAEQAFIAMIMGSGNTSVDVYKVTITLNNTIYPSVLSYDLIGNIPSVTTALADQYRPSFVLAPNSSNAEVMYMCVGGTKVYQTDATSLVDISAAQSPAISALDTVVEVEYLNRRVLALVKDTQQVYYSSTTDPEDFAIASGGGFFEAESNPDKLQRMIVKGQELVLMGTDTIDYYYGTGDSTVPFARFEGGELDIGLTERGLAVADDNDIYFLDNNRKFKLLRGKQTKDLSLPYAEKLQNVTDITDAVAIVVQFNSKKYVWLTFPNDRYVNGSTIGSTHVYDIQYDRWYKWGDYNFNYDNGTIDDLPMIPHTAAAYCDTVGNQFVASDEIRHFHETVGHSDLETLVVTSGSIDLDTHMRKSSNRITGRVKAVTDDITLRYRETLIENSNWTVVNSVPNYTERTISAPSDYFLKEMRFGQYRIRQYQIRHMTGEFHMSDLTEWVEVLGS